MSDEAIVNGEQYTARPQMKGQTGTCAGCAASDQTLTQAKRDALCWALPPCMAAARDDGKFVVWIKQ